MYISLRTTTIIYKAALGFLSVLGAWVSFATFGSAAWRVFLTWILIISAIYYILSALVFMLNKKRRANDTPCPMLEGMIIVSLVLCGVTAVACFASEIEHPMITGLMAALVYVTLPILAVGGWLLFSKKGAWHLISPFYWLALPLTYVGFILFSTEVSSANLDLPYPLPFLDYQNYDLANLFTWLLFFAVIILVFSYTLVVIDAIMGGQVAKNIVLPHIKTLQTEPATTQHIATESDDKPIIAEPIIHDPDSQSNSNDKPKNNHHASQKSGHKSGRINDFSKNDTGHRSSRSDTAQATQSAKKPQSTKNAQQSTATNIKNNIKTTDGIKPSPKKKPVNTEALNDENKTKVHVENNSKDSSKDDSKPNPSQPKRVEDVEYRKRDMQDIRRPSVKPKQSKSQSSTEAREVSVDDIDNLSSSKPQKVKE